MKFLSAVVLSAVATLALAPVPVSSHCELPCGIYGDEMRFEMIDEHIRTLEKSMRKIEMLASARAEGSAVAENENQLVRWVVNKESHAEQLRSILTVYFLDQRIKPVEAGTDGHDRYRDILETVHRMMVRVMKCTQTTDQAHIEKLRQLRQTLHDQYHELAH